jgi:hypothetical protein
MKLFTLISCIFILAISSFAGSCPKTITACGCTVSKEGIYNVADDLTASQGLTKDGNCLDVTDEHVTLFTNGYDIIGNGSGSGIYLSKEAKHTFMEAAGPKETYTTVSGWQYGLESHGNGLLSEGFYFVNNNTGILLDADNDHISMFGSYNNSERGIYVVSGHGNQLTDGGTWNNHHAGIELDKCSKDTTIIEVYFYPGVETYGILVNNGSTGNRIVDNWPAGTNSVDLFDGNDEGDNLWHSNRFVTANQPFIQ